MAPTLDELQGQICALYELKAIDAKLKQLQNRQRFAVLAARKEGCSWQQIGDQLGMTRQAAWERYRT